MQTATRVVKNKEARDYASRAKIHLAYLWLFQHCLNLSDEHKQAITKQLEKQNEKFTKAYEEAKKKAAIKDLLEPTLMQIDIAEKLYDLENVQLVRSFPATAQIPQLKNTRLAVIEYALNEAFNYDLFGVPGFYFRGGIFRLNLPSWHTGLLKPYTIDERIAGAFLYRHVTDSMPALLSSHNLFIGKRFIEPETEGDLLG